MDLLKTMADYACKDQAVERAAFEAAMIEKLQTEPYKMSDMLFEVYSCRKEIEGLGCAIQHLWTVIEELEDQLVSKKKAKKA